MIYIINDEPQPHDACSGHCGRIKEKHPFLVLPLIVLSLRRNRFA